MTTVKAQLKRLRIAPNKVRLVADAVRGLQAPEAVAQLSVMEKRAARPMLKLLNSALANAKDLYNLSPEDLRITTLLVNEGLILKRWMPRAHGRATKLLKRTSHITMILESSVDAERRATAAPVSDTATDTTADTKKTDVPEKKTSSAKKSTA